MLLPVRCFRGLVAGLRGLFSVDSGSPYGAAEGIPNPRGSSIPFRIGVGMSLKYFNRIICPHFVQSLLDPSAYLTPAENLNEVSTRYWLCNATNSTTCRSYWPMHPTSPVTNTTYKEAIFIYAEFLLVAQNYWLFLSDSPVNNYYIYVKY